MFRIRKNKKIAPAQNLQITNPSLQRAVSMMERYKIDTLFVSSCRSCSYCGQYNQKVFSYYGWNRNFPPLPTVVYGHYCPECGKIPGVTFYFPGISK